MIKLLLALVAKPSANHRRAIDKHSKGVALKHYVLQSPAEKKSRDSKGLHSSLSAASRDSKADQRRLTVKAVGSEAC